MSDLRRIPVKAVAAVGLALLTTTVVHAQSDVDYLKRQYDAVAARRLAVAHVLDSVRKASATVYDDSLAVGSRRIRFVRAQISDSDEALLVSALEADAARLRADFGASAD